MPDFITSHIVAGLLECDSATKQDLGQHMARHLRLKEGTCGRDDGIDGSATWGARQILFQAKLKKTLIGPDDAKIFWADLIRHRMTDGIYLAGIGYTEGFRTICRQLQSFVQEMGCPMSCHLLTLADIFEKTEVLKEAALVLPPVADLQQALSSG